MPLLLLIFFQLQQQWVQHRMKENLESGMLCTIRIKKTEFFELRKGKEILFGERLFDIKEKKDDGDYLILKGLYDQQEDRINDALKNLGQKKNNDPQNNTMVKLFQQVLYCDTYSALPASLIFTVSKKHCAPNKPWHSIAPATDTPPPKS
jgi:hypothetical protein